MRTNRRLSTVILAAACFVAASSQAGERFKVLNGYIVVQATINGQGPFSMLLDTGGARCALMPEVAARLGLVPQRRLVLATFTNEKAVPATEVAIRIGSSEELVSEALIYDLPGVGRVGRGIAGLLGATFLAQRPFLIDYRAGLLLLGGEAVAKSREYAAEVALDFSYGRPVLSARDTRTAQPWRLVLDSGVDRVVLLCSDGCPDLIGTRRITGITNAGQSEVIGGRLPALIVAGERRTGVNTVVVRGSPETDRIDGSLPLSWFRAIYVDTALGLIRFPR